MKKQIRYNTFETNSSNVNTLTIMTKEEYEVYIKKWNSPDWVWDNWEDEWVLDADKDEDGNPRWKDSGWRYSDNPLGDYYEVETKEYTTKHGDEIVAVSIYGHD